MNRVKIVHSLWFINTTILQCPDWLIVTKKNSKILFKNFVNYIKLVAVGRAMGGKSKRKKEGKGKEALDVLLNVKMDSGHTRFPCR